MTDKNYVTTDDFRDYIKDKSSNLENEIAACIAAASRECDSYCGRYFYQQPETQMYFPEDWWNVDLGDMDLATASGLTVQTDTAGDGSYATTLVIGTDFQLEPVNQSSNGINPWPYEYLRGIRPGVVFPIHYTPWQRPTVKVVGTYGWPAIPDPVAQATRIIAAQLFKMADAPLGVAGFNGWGEVRVKDVPQAAMLLRPYMKGSSVGIA